MDNVDDREDRMYESQGNHESCLHKHNPIERTGVGLGGLLSHKVAD